MLVPLAQRTTKATTGLLALEPSRHIDARHQREVNGRRGDVPHWVCTPPRRRAPCSSRSVRVGRGALRIFPGDPALAPASLPSSRLRTGRPTDGGGQSCVPVGMHGKRT